MDLSRLRRGELIAAIGGLVLLIALFLFDWYGNEAAKISIGVVSGEVGVSFGPWYHPGFLGALADLVLLLAAVVAVGLAFLTASSRTVALPVAASAVTAALGVAAVTMVIGRMLFQPGPNVFIDLKFGIFLALFGAIAIAIGGWQSMQEEGATFARPSDRPPRADEFVAPPPPPPSEPPGPPGSAPPPPGPGDRR